MIHKWRFGAINRRVNHKHLCSRTDVYGVGETYMYNLLANLY